MKKITMRRFWAALAMVLAIQIMMGGCTGMNRMEEKVEHSINESRDSFLAHMEEKYGVPFLPISYVSSGYVTGEEFRCYAKGTDRERDVVCVFREEKDGKVVFYDDYFSVLIREEYRSRVQSICDEVIGSSKAYVYKFSASYFSNSLTADSTLDDAIAMGENINASKYIYFEVAPGSEAEFEEICDRVAQRLQEEKLIGFVQFLGLAHGQLDRVNAENFRDAVPSLLNPDGEICLMMGNRVVLP